VRPAARSSDANGAAVARFAAGDTIFCLPYGDGVVRESQLVGGREQLVVDFANHGELTIDPVLSLVRKLEGPAAQDDDLL
jgi:hypothetical protein